jgi:hypothetical protein
MPQTPLLCRALSRSISGLRILKVNTPQQARGLTRMFYPWRSSCCGGLLIDPECPALLIGFEGRHSGSCVSSHSEWKNFLSMTSNLLFGSRQHLVDESSWVPVHGFRRGRIKLLTGSPAPTRGGRSRPIRVSRCGLDSCSSFSQF